MSTVYMIFFGLLLICSSHDATRDQSCGKCLEEVVSERIEGGADAKPGAWPWMAGLYRKYRESAPEYLVGGASIIDERHLVTTAHSFGYSARFTSQWSIRVGSIRQHRGTRHFVEKITLHPHYNGQFNDIAVIRLKDPILFGTNVRNISLPTSSEMRDMNLTGRNVTVLGWGFQSSRTHTSTILQEVTMQVFHSRSCRGNYGNYGFQQDLANQRLCAGERGKSVCEGDSGGPMMLFENDTWVLVGVVKSGICGSGHPSNFVRVTYFIDWLQEATADSVDPMSLGLDVK